MLCRIALWESFRGRVLTQLFAQLIAQPIKRSDSAPRQLHSAIGPFPAYSHETFFTKKNLWGGLKRYQIQKEHEKISKQWILLFAPSNCLLNFGLLAVFTSKTVRSVICAPAKLLWLEAMNQLNIASFVLNYLTVLLHANTIIHLSFGHSLPSVHNCYL